MTFSEFYSIIQKLSVEDTIQNAAIAQPVERILGKDEVASSNLASSSIKTPKPFGFGVFICIDRFERSNAAWQLQILETLKVSRVFLILCCELGCVLFR